jgi:hypothetical protein
VPERPTRFARFNSLSRYIPRFGELDCRQIQKINEGRHLARFRYPQGVRNHFSKVGAVSHCHSIIALATAQNRSVCVWRLPTPLASFIFRLWRFWSSGEWRRDHKAAA